MKGTVTSNKMAKTVVVEIVRKKKHPKYGKYVNRRTKVYAHTEDPVEVGSEVVVRESKPISKSKRWQVIEVINSNTE